MDWFAAVTTAPRAGPPLLPDTLASLAAAGWPMVEVFAEPGARGTHQNTERLWPWGNFLQAVRHGVESGAERIAVVQDDLLIARGLRRYLNDIGDGIYSPYSPGVLSEIRRHEYGSGTGWVTIPEHFLRLRTHGACFYAMNAETARNLNDTADAMVKRENTNARISIDGWIGKWCYASKVPLRHHVPSLVQHVGEYSSLNKDNERNQLPKTRRATDFVSDAEGL